MSRITCIVAAYCSECDVYISTVKIDKRNPICPHCKHKCKLKCVDKTLVHNEKYQGNITYAKNERYSEAMGVQVEQIPEAMRMFPDSEYHPETGALRIKNRAHKLKEMKRRGCAEFDGNSGSWRKHGHKVRTKRSR